VALARPGGTVVLAGTRGSEDTPGFSPDTVVYKELRLVGALGVDAPAYLEALALLASGRHPFADVSRRTVPLEGVADLLADMAGEGSAPPPLHGVVVPGA
jgi:alcohol dehydrogenase